MSAGRYAAGTDVAPDRSRAEIERLIERYGAHSFAYGWDKASGMAIIGFTMHERQVRFRLRMPDPDDDEFWTTATGRERTAKSAKEAHDQEVRRRWRALALVIKAKLESIEAGIESFESAFLSQILLPDGRTYGEYAVPQIARVYEAGEMPPLLPGLVAADVRALGAGER